jgi:hypothetical protein
MYNAAGEQVAEFDELRGLTFPDDGAYKIVCSKTGGVIERKAVVTHRMRRGRLVEIPEAWRGKVTHDQTKRKRQPVKRRTRKNK